MPLPAPYYSRDGITIYHGDCLTILPELPAGSVDAVVTDPPYGIAVGAAFVRLSLRQVDNGSGMFNEGVGWRWLDTPDWLIASGNVAVFHKREDVLPPHLTWWHKFYLVKDAPPPTPRPVFVNAVEECSIGRNGGKIRWFGTGYEPNYWRGLTPNRLNQSHGHPSEKPLDAIEKLVRCLSGESETVLDPFLGSGTTAVACIKTGRKCIGIELSEKYCAIAARRCEEAFDSQALFRQEQPA